MKRQRFISESWTRFFFGQWSWTPCGNGTLEGENAAWGIFHVRIWRTSYLDKPATTERQKQTVQASCYDGTILTFWHNRIAQRKSIDELCGLRRYFRFQSAFSHNDRQACRRTAPFYLESSCASDTNVSGTIDTFQEYPFVFSLLTAPLFTNHHPFAGNLLFPEFAYPLPVCLIRIVSQRYLPCLSCMQGHAWRFTTKSPPLRGRIWLWNPA